MSATFASHLILRYFDVEHRAINLCKEQRAAAVLALGINHLSKRQSDQESKQWRVLKGVELHHSNAQLTATTLARVHVQNAQ